MQENLVNSIEADLELLNKYVEELREKKKQLEKDNLKLDILIKELQEESY